MITRVLLMISSLRGGGSEQQTLLLLRYLDRSRFAPHLYLTHSTGDLLPEVPPDVPIHSPDSAVHRRGIYFPGRILRRQVRDLAEIIQRNQIDVVYDRTFHMTMIAGPACSATGTPRVSTIVSPPDLALPLVEKRFVELKRRRLAKAYRQARQVVAVSSAAATSAEAFYRLPESSVQVIPNPVDEAQLRKRVDRHPIKSDPGLTFVCVGRMSAEKGHRDLFEAFGRLAGRIDPRQRLRLQLVGDGPLKEELQNHARHLESELIAIDFLGQQPEAAPWIAAADALILPSHFEGMPNVALEAMALGTPVIATRAGGTIDLELEEPTIWWCEPKNSNSLADSIVRFISQPHQRQARIEASRRMVREHHRPQKIVPRIEALLQPSSRPTA